MLTSLQLCPRLRFVMRARVRLYCMGVHMYNVCAGYLSFPLMYHTLYVWAALSLCRWLFHVHSMPNVMRPPVKGGVKDFRTADRPYTHTHKHHLMICALDCMQKRNGETAHSTQYVPRMCERCVTVMCVFAIMHIDHNFRCALDTFSRCALILCVVDRVANMTEEELWWELLLWLVVIVSMMYGTSFFFNGWVCWILLIILTLQC